MEFAINAIDAYNQAGWVFGGLIMLLIGGLLLTGIIFTGIAAFLFALALAVAVMLALLARYEPGSRAHMGGGSTF